MAFSMKKIALTFYILTLGLIAQAQTLSILYKLPPVAQKTTYLLSGQNADKLDAEDNAPKGKPQALSIGRLFSANITPQTGGEWTTVPNGRIWRLKITAEGAKGVSLYGQVNTFPQGAKLVITNGQQIGNTYTAQSFAIQNIISTETVLGESIIVEYFEPKEVTNTGSFVIEKIGYMYRTNDDGMGMNTAAFRQSGPCQVNVNCTEGKLWKYQRDAVVLIKAISDITIQWCTGTLMHNTKKDFKPYILTAMHCALDGTGKKLSNDTVFKYWVFYFNYQAPTCATPISEDTLANRFITGSQVLAHSDDQGGELGSDFLLVQMSQRPPASWNPYYAGWNLDTASQFDSGVSIHHPKWDIKKISTYRWPLSTFKPYTTSPDKTHWQVLWSATTNGHGVTEGGSSGAALFDSRGNVVGTLTGGNSSCSNTNRLDYYGRMDWHWTKNDTGKTRQLKYWLDPEKKGGTNFDGETYYNVGIQEAATVQWLTLFPNPAQNVIGFSSAQLLEGAMQITILNVLGQECYTANTEQPQADITGLPAGVYFITVKQKNNYFTSKFIKE